MEDGMRRKRRQLSPEEKWEVFLEVTSQQLSQADAARKVGRRCKRCDSAAGVGQGRGVGRVRVRQAGSAGVCGGGRARAVADGERPAVRGLEGACGRALVAAGKAALGLFGPVGARVSAQTKLELLGLIDAAVAAGWAHARACRVLALADVRVHRWRARLRDTGTLDDRPPIGSAVHRLLAWEEQAILELIEQLGVGGSLAPQARASRLVCRCRVRLALDAVARRPQKPGCAARRAGPSAIAFACITRGSRVSHFWGVAGTGWVCQWWWRRVGVGPGFGV